MISTLDQNQILGVTVKKIALANESDLNPLTISDSTKTKLRDSIHAGHLVYVPSQQFTYQSWTGLVYIDLDPNTGYGGYIIGEGLNGGYTVEPIEAWEGSLRFYITDFIENLTVTVTNPTQNQQFLIGNIIHWIAIYQGNYPGAPTIPVSWTEQVDFDTSSWNPSTYPLISGYGTNQTINAIVNTPPPDDSGDDPIKISEGFNEKYVIKNSGFNNSASMTENDIQAFLDEKATGNPNHLASKVFSGHRAAYWIKKGADMWGINPRILIAKLQTEQGLITGSRSINPNEFQLEWAINAGFTESAVYAKYKGFTTQMLKGAEDFLRRWYNRANEVNYIIDPVDINEDPNSDTWYHLFKVLNASTFSLYKFTPHVYEGGRLVYVVYNDFFGNNDLGGLTQ